MKKMLILNGSPHSNGDTAYIIEKLKERINNKIEICELHTNPILNLVLVASTVGKMKGVQSSMMI